MGTSLLCYFVLTWVPIAISALLFAAWNAATGDSLPVLPLTAFLVVLRQVNVFTISSLFHRSYSHRQFEYHPALEWLVRRWNWLFMGTGGRAWAMMHRWHHAASDTDDDP